jgi:hypothetical protein
MLGLNLVIDILAPNGKNIPSGNLTGGVWQTVTCHDTANTAPGANARMHWQFVKNGGGPGGVSFTFVVDDKEAIQILRENQINYAQGTPSGNTTSISIERCVNRDANAIKSIDNNCKLVAALLVAYDESTLSVIQHHAWYGKNCPASLRAVPGAWTAFINKIAEYVNELKDMLAPEPPAPIVINGFTIQGGFLGLWDLHGLEVMGLPLSNEYQEVVAELGGVLVTFQDFENVVVEYYPGIQARIGAGIRKYKYSGG